MRTSSTIFPEEGFQILASNSAFPKLTELLTRWVKSVELSWCKDSTMKGKTEVSISLNYMLVPIMSFKRY